MDEQPSTDPEVEQTTAWIRAAQDGDRAAFGQLVRAYEWPIRAWVYAHCPPGGDREDVAQRVFIEAFKNLLAFEAGTDFKAWLFTIARYQLMAERTRLARSARNRERYALHAIDQELERRAEEGHPGESGPAERLQHLRECLLQLDERGREAIRLRYREDVGLAAIAEATGRSVGAIKKYLFKLRLKLHDCIERKAAAAAGG